MCLVDFKKKSNSGSKFDLNLILLIHAHFHCIPRTLFLLTFIQTLFLAQLWIHFILLNDTKAKTFE